MDEVFSKAGVAAEALGISTAQLKRWARDRRLPDGSVISTPGGHYRYDIDAIRRGMAMEYKSQTVEAVR